MRRRHNSLTSLPSAAGTVAVPAELARNMGQSSAAAGALAVGAVHGTDSALSDGGFSATRGAMELVP